MIFENQLLLDGELGLISSNLMIYDKKNLANLSIMACELLKIKQTIGMEIFLIPLKR